MPISEKEVREIFELCKERLRETYKFLPEKNIEALSSCEFIGVDPSIEFAQNTRGKIKTGILNGRGEITLLISHELMHSLHGYWIVFDGFNRRHISLEGNLKIERVIPQEIFKIISDLIHEILIDGQLKVLFPNYSDIWKNLKKPTGGYFSQDNMRDSDIIFVMIERDTKLYIRENQLDRNLVDLTPHFELILNKHKKGLAEKFGRI